MKELSEWELGRETRLFNGSLRKLRLSRGLTQKEFGEKIGVAGVTIGSYENMRAIPNEEVSKKIAKFFGKEPEEIFPREFLKEIKKKPKSVVEFAKMEHAELAWATESTALLEENTNPEGIVREKEMKEVVNGALEDLTDREKKIIKMRFGLDGDCPHSATEVADFFDVTRERIRQIEERAIKKLRKNNSIKNYSQSLREECGWGRETLAKQ